MRAPAKLDWPPAGGSRASALGAISEQLVRVARGPTSGGGGQQKRARPAAQVGVSRARL